MIKSCKMFFTPTCPKCPKIKEFLGGVKIEKEMIDASTPEGLEKARELNVISVPAVIFFDENGKEVSRANTIEEIKRVVENKPLSDV